MLTWALRALTTSHVTRWRSFPNTPTTPGRAPSFCCGPFVLGAGALPRRRGNGGAGACYTIGIRCQNSPRPQTGDVLRRRCALDNAPVPKIQKTYAYASRPGSATPSATSSSKTGFVLSSHWTNFRHSKAAFCRLGVAFLRLYDYSLQP